MIDYRSNSSSKSKKQWTLKELQDLASKHEGSKDHVQKNAIVLIAQPRSGSTLVTRLYGLGFSINNGSIYSELPIDWISLMLEAYKSKPKFDDGIFQSFCAKEIAGYFQDVHMNTNSKDHFYKLFDHHIRALLGINYKGIMKTNMLGFGNSLLEPFVDMLRGMDEDNSYHKINIVFLTRDSEEIADSILSRPNPIQADRSKIIELADKQQQEFKRLRTLDDLVISYNKLLDDPIGCMLKMGIPKKTMNLGCVKDVLNKIIR